MRNLGTSFLLIVSMLGGCATKEFYLEPSGEKLAKLNVRYVGPNIIGVFTFKHAKDCSGGMLFLNESGNIAGGQGITISLAPNQLFTIFYNYQSLGYPEFKHCKLIGTFTPEGAHSYVAIAKIEEETCSLSIFGVDPESGEMQKTVESSFYSRTYKQPPFSSTDSFCE